MVWALASAVQLVPNHSKRIYFSKYENELPRLILYYGTDIPNLKSYY